MLVQREIADAFTEALVKEVSSLVVGDPLDESTDVSALISPAERDRVKAWVDEAVGQGAAVAHGGELDDHGVLVPTVLTNTAPDMKVCSQEVFGPVVVIAAYDDLDEALRLANDTRYGLQAAIFTRDIGDAIKALHTLDFGGVLVNEVPTWRADQQPYGGVRDSGNTREGPAYSVREMTEVRMVVLSGMSLRWGVLGARSQNHRTRLRPAFGLAGARIVNEASRRGEDLSAYDDVLADPDVDAVYITLPNAMHAAWVLKALTAGKHVLCEKPLTLSAADTITLYETAKAVDRHLGEAFMWPHHPRSQRLRELVAKGDLGPLRRPSGHVHVRPRPPDRPPLRRAAAAGRCSTAGSTASGRRCASPTPSRPRSRPRAAHNTAGVDVAMDGWVALGTWVGASFTVSMAAPGRRNQTVIGHDGVVVVDNHFPGPERPGALTVVRADGPATRSSTPAPTPTSGWSRRSPPRPPATSSRAGRRPSRSAWRPSSTPSTRRRRRI